MSADFSKVRFNPYLNYAGVELQQGRVLLDADANELVAVLDRRLRALAGDVLGRATVGANTPDAFKLSLVAGALQIGRGRLYVDGLLAENHGSGAATFDALMGGPSFSEATPIADQPWLVNPPLPTAGRHLVYLDVWNREVTHLEQPDLVEPAVGVDATTRLQTVWQVRVLDNAAAAGIDCASPDDQVPGWADLTAPSGGRLTTGSFDLAPTANPCELPPEGGYRGLENQLYRIEIHDAGLPGAGASFKWSRDNASVGSRVTRFLSATEVELQSLGHDDVLRFNTGDWVEFIDDPREFEQAPGELRRVTVSDDKRSLSFATALLGMQPANLADTAWVAARNLRVRRWDQKGRVLRVTGTTTALAHDLDGPGATGAIPIPASGTLLMENGITLSFGSVGTTGFRSGDWWVVAARTLDASLEALTNAPPRGTHHHYARLGFWDVAAGTVSDCRHPWPPEGGADCACTVCVSPQSHASGQLTIQAAVDRVREIGGTICLNAGAYELAEPVRIANAKSLRITGQGPATVLGTPGTAFSVSASAAVAIDSLAILSTGAGGPAIQVRSVIGLTLEKLAVVVAGERGVAITLGGAVAGLAVRDNLLIATHGIRAGAAAAAGTGTTTNNPTSNRREFLFTASARFTGNIFWCRSTGLALTGLVGHLYATRVSDNEFLLCREGAIQLLGFCMPGAAMHVDGNTLAVTGPGIRCAVDGAWITNNKLHAQTQGNNPPLGAGITLSTGLDPNGSDQCQVLANQVSGFPAAGILIEAPTRSLIVKLNIIERCGHGILMADSASAGLASIENNHLQDIGALQAETASARLVVGIGVVKAEACSVVGNTLLRIGVAPVERSVLVAGIFGSGVGNGRVHGNSMSAIGPSGDFRGALAGILWLGPYDELDLSHNQVRRDDEPVTAPGATRWIGVEVVPITANQPVVRSVGYMAMRVDATRTIVVRNDRATMVNSKASNFAAAARADGGSCAGMKGNVVAARGTGPAVLLGASADILFADNRCELNGTAEAVVVLTGQTLIVSANRVNGPPDRSMLLNANPKLVTVLGNITNHAIASSAGPLEPKWLDLNIHA